MTRDAVDAARTFNVQLKQRGEKLLTKDHITICGPCYKIHQAEQDKVIQERGDRYQRARHDYMTAGLIAKEFAFDHEFKKWCDKYDEQGKTKPRKGGGNF